MTPVAEKVHRGPREAVYGYAVVVLAILLFGALVRTELVDTVSVTSDSMAPTICTGGVVLIARWNAQAVQVNEIVTFSSPIDDAATIKRVVGVAGQTVAIEDGQLVVDGLVRSEPYVDQETIDGVYYGPVTVPDGTVLVMGDHREVSVDSRSYGPVSTGDINGRRLATLWSSCPG